MKNYECHVCGASCDPGELENGVCFDCRVEARERKESRTLDNIRAWNQMLRRQADGQMVVNYGK